MKATNVDLNSFSGNYISRKALKPITNKRKVSDTIGKDNLYKHYMRKQYQENIQKRIILQEMDKIMRLFGF